MSVSNRTVSRRRLSKLADFLYILPRKKFNYSNWSIPDDKKPKSCGTAACAWGWTPAVPGFRRLGVKPNGDEGPTFEGKHGFNGAAAFFRISSDDAWMLFSPQVGEGKATPKYVARKIRRWIGENLS